jgi:mono/diheme cytochrome c family protein
MHIGVACHALIRCLEQGVIHRRIRSAGQSRRKSDHRNSGARHYDEQWQSVLAAHSHTNMFGNRENKTDAIASGNRHRIFLSWILKRRLRMKANCVLGESPCRFAISIIAAITGVATVAAASALAQAVPRDGRALYDSACASCHGTDGRGRSRSEVGFDTPLPDFSDCAFASREPDGDWFAVTHEGGPRRAFDRMMPAFGDALESEEIEAILSHIRTFCTNQAWPRGEFNLPLALFTEKAFPEDEAVWRTVIDAEGPTSITSELTYERRFGPRGQLELTLPFVLADPGARHSTQAGIGDVEVAWKQNMLADLNSGTIFSLGGAAILPTGDSDKGFGSGVVVLEPFALFGKILSDDAFLQGQLFGEFPLNDSAGSEVGWRLAVGRTWASENGFGRAWTPMVEVLGSRELSTGAKIDWDIVPQLQVSLSQRQHILFNAGARIPLNDMSARHTQFVFYVIWDWYDGGLWEGWR